MVDAQYSKIFVGTILPVRHFLATRQSPPSPLMSGSYKGDDSSSEKNRRPRVTYYGVVVVVE
eukprot:CAMPEP_0114335694 /NCGR_PEP_ID=MMETSP0101-20121206/5216_1 /TAXON_ID=38822 ORGANISM="Pteridomonas danica, Strain PT" /NCGR_SAMPLE_ID=MMETSP0101 /ASSEMBLY_ACC=CAM_ASM_000211 /LENGTH=61 /DNA_ID=CAMNT_0001467379 /DNA_START=129 /DNA_END=311 /DNA_ORIENTATION=-